MVLSFWDIEKEGIPVSTQVDMVGVNGENTGNKEKF